MQVQQKSLVIKRGDWVLCCVHAKESCPPAHYFIYNKAGPTDPAFLMCCEACFEEYRHYPEQIQIGYEFMADGDEFDKLITPKELQS